jgi:hypothetical protein
VLLLLLQLAVLLLMAARQARHAHSTQQQTQQHCRTRQQGQVCSWGGTAGCQGGQGQSGAAKGAQAVVHRAVMQRLQATLLPLLLALVLVLRKRALLCHQQGLWLSPWGSSWGSWQQHTWPALSLTVPKTWQALCPGLCLYSSSCGVQGLLGLGPSHSQC